MIRSFEANDAEGSTLHIEMNSVESMHVYPNQINIRTGGAWHQVKTTNGAAIVEQWRKDVGQL